MSQWRKLVVAHSLPVRRALRATANPHGLVIVVDDNSRLIGALTDAEIRRAIANGVRWDDPVAACLREPSAAGDEPGTLALSHAKTPRGVDLSAARILVLDFDGVMTDNRVLVMEDGREAVWCHRGDGLGIARLHEAGVPVVVLSTEANPVVAARCRKLRIDCQHGLDDKLSALRRLAQDAGIAREDVAYVGNDVNDVPCMKWAGVPIAVADAVPEALAVARLVTVRRGGRGAVREVADWIVNARAGAAGSAAAPRENAGE